VWDMVNGMNHTVDSPRKMMHINRHDVRLVMRKIQTAKQGEEEVLQRG